MPTRDERLYENEKLFRSANERLKEHVAEAVAPGATIPFLCECVDEDCMIRVELGLDDYRRVRASARTFLVAPGHAKPEIEEVKETHVRFQIVEKAA